MLAANTLPAAIPQRITLGLAGLSLVTLLSLPPALAYELLINCGAGVDTTQAGVVFEADRAYSPGGAGYLPEDTAGRVLTQEALDQGCGVMLLA